MGKLNLKWIFNKKKIVSLEIQAQLNEPKPRSSPYHFSGNLSSQPLPQEIWADLAKGRDRSIRRAPNQCIEETEQRFSLYALFHRLAIMYLSWGLRLTTPPKCFRSERSCQCATATSQNAKPQEFLSSSKDLYENTENFQFQQVQQMPCAVPLTFPVSCSNMPTSPFVGAACTTHENSFRCRSHILYKKKKNCDSLGGDVSTTGVLITHTTGFFPLEVEPYYDIPWC